MKRAPDSPSCFPRDEVKLCHIGKELVVVYRRPPAPPIASHVQDVFIFHPSMIHVDKLAGLAYRIDLLHAQRRRGCPRCAAIVCHVKDYFRPSVLGIPSGSVEKGILVIYTHNPDLAARYARRVIEIVDGRVASDAATGARR